MPSLIGGSSVGPVAAQGEVKRGQQALDGILFFCVVFLCMYFFVFDFTFGIASLEIYLVIVLITLLLLVLRCICFPIQSCCCLCCPLNLMGMEKCPLCRGRLSQQSMLEHRITCQSLNCEILDSYPVLYPEALCPTCTAPLRSWPEDAIAAFACRGCGEAIRNRGNNLFKCFGCDHNLCLDCIQLQLGILRERKQRVRRQQEESARIDLIRTVEEQTRSSMVDDTHAQEVNIMGGGEVSPPPSYGEALDMV